METLKEIIVPIVITLLTALVGYLSTKLEKWFEKKEQGKIKKSDAENVVKFVEQAYKGLSGTDKYQKALESLSEMLEQKGIPVTDLELRVLIESCVAEFNKPWEKTTEGDEPVG